MTLSRGTPQGSNGLRLDDRDVAPVAVAEIELSEPIREIPGTDETGRLYRGAHVFVRLHSRPMGVVNVRVERDGVTTEDLTTAIWEALAERINEHLRADGLPEVSRLEPDGLPAPELPVCVRHREALLRDGMMASVIICTRNRPESLRRTLASLERLDYPNFEVIVVDGSADGATRALVAKTFPTFDTSTSAIMERASRRTRV